jgi:hypothetical protein
MSVNTKGEIDIRVDVVDLQVDVGVMKQQITNITSLCGKMDSLIEKMMEKQDKIESEIYNHVEKKQEETTSDVKELHSRITTVDRNLSDKLELTERRIMDEIKSLRQEINAHNQREDDQIEKILEWKWMAAGGIIVIAWLLSHVKFDIISKLFG